jgi:hypothetical protein
MEARTGLLQGLSPSVCPNLRMTLFRAIKIKESIYRINDCCSLGHNAIMDSKDSKLWNRRTIMKKALLYTAGLIVAGLIGFIDGAYIMPGFAATEPHVESQVESVINDTQSINNTVTKADLIADIERQINSAISDSKNFARVTQEVGIAEYTDNIVGDYPDMTESEKEDFFNKNKKFRPVQ